MTTQSLPVAVLWDMDGTLLDTEPMWDIAMIDLARRHGIAMTDELRASTLGNSSYNAIAKVLRAAAVPVDDGVVSENERWISGRVEELFTGALPWRAGAVEALDLVGARGIPMALVTNTIRKLTDVALDTIGAHRFTVSVCGDEVAAAKPAPDPYLLAARQLGVRPEHCLVFEDSPTGATAAGAAGCPTVVVGTDAELQAVPVFDRQTRRNSLVGLTVADLSSAASISHAKIGTREDLR